jgi:hypothetical protein
MQMVGHGTKFGRKHEAAIVALLSQRTIEEAARAADIGVTTLIRWMKDPDFDKAYRTARRTAFGQAIARMHQASGTAVTVLIKVMVDPSTPASSKVRAADSILDRGLKAITMEDFEARLIDLERATELAEKGRKR